MNLPRRRPQEVSNPPSSRETTAFRRCLRLMSNVILLPLMTARRFSIPILASLVATPLLLFAAVAYAGAGHGSYFLAKISSHSQ